MGGGGPGCLQRNKKDMIHSLRFCFCSREENSSSTAIRTVLLVMSINTCQKTRKPPNIKKALLIFIDFGCYLPIVEKRSDETGFIKNLNGQALTMKIYSNWLLQSLAIDILVLITTTPIAEKTNSNIFYIDYIKVFVVLRSNDSIIVSFFLFYFIEGSNYHLNFFLRHS